MAETMVSMTFAIAEMTALMARPIAENMDPYIRASQVSHTKFISERVVKRTYHDGRIRYSSSQVRLVADSVVEGVSHFIACALDPLVHR